MADELRKRRVGILGASGYTGGELVRLLARHADVEIVLLSAERHAGKALDTVFPHLGALRLPDLVSIDEIEWPGLDVELMFCALPHGTSQEIVAGLLHDTGHGLVDELIVETRGDLVAGLKREVKVIDLSADFRLADPGVYAEWYGHEHRAPRLQAEAVYGLSELAREAIAKARLIACPGCYPTAAILPLAPLLEAGQVAAEEIIIDAKSGVSGAGRALREDNLFAEVAEGVHAYGIAAHRHGPEIEQELSKAAGRAVVVNFTPHLVPMNRGLLATIYVRLEGGASAEDLRQTLLSRYEGEPFVQVLAEGVAPATRHVRGSNTCLIGVFADRVAGRAILIAALDTLVKGGSGQAVQNMNLALGLPETRGLEQPPLFP